MHASWLNQVEVYFSLLQRKVLTPNDSADLQELELRIRLYEELTNKQPKPFDWKFTKYDLFDLLQRLGQEGSRRQGFDARHPGKPGLTWSPQIQPYRYLRNGPLSKEFQSAFPRELPTRGGGENLTIVRHGHHRESSGPRSVIPTGTRIIMEYLGPK